jgi:hypothetical protein
MSENSFGWSYFANENDNNKDIKINKVPSLAERDIGKTTINEKDNEWTSVNGPSVDGPSATKFESNDETRTGVSIVSDVTNKDKNYITLSDLPTKSLNGLERAGCSPLANHLAGTTCPLRDAVVGERLNSVDGSRRSSTGASQSVSGDAIASERAGDEATESRKSAEESDKNPSMNYVDEPKYDYLTNIYVGSLTIVGLYIFFRIIEKSK